MGTLLWKVGRHGYAFLIGMGSVLDLSGHSLFDQQQEQSALDAIGSDFRRVGMDINNVMLGHDHFSKSHDANQKQLEFQGILR